MLGLKRIAAATAEDIRLHKQDGCALQWMSIFANRLNEVATRSMGELDLGSMLRVAHVMGEHDIKCEGDLYLWWRGLAGEASLLALPRQHQLDSSKLTQNVLALCDTLATVKLTRKRVAKKARKKQRRKGRR